MRRSFLCGCTRIDLLRSIVFVVLWYSHPCLHRDCAQVCEGQRLLLLRLKCSPSLQFFVTLRVLSPLRPKPVSCLPSLLRTVFVTAIALFLVAHHVRVCCKDSSSVSEQNCDQRFSVWCPCFGPHTRLGSPLLQ